MIIEIRRAGFLNKGAELMLLAAVQKLRDRYPDAKITMAPIFGCTDDTYEKMCAASLYPKAWLWRYGINWGVVAKYLPERIIKMHGLVHDHEVDIVIDAAGFSYSEQWGPRNSRELASSSKKWKKNDTTLILLPQAFGPFNNNKIKKYAKEFISNSDLIFAREVDSLNYLKEITDEHEKIKLFPDFTNLINGTIPENFDTEMHRFALVPNYRMIDMTSKAESDAYIPFMVSCAKYLKLKDSKPFLLVHEGDDDQILAEEISRQAGSIPIVKETNPLHIKGILGSCNGTIGSRFHGLVSALSQGVPSLATGWSHKYRRLFEDYGFIEGLVNTKCSEDEIHFKIDMILNSESSNKLKDRISMRATELKELSNEMWELVFNKIDEKMKDKI